MGKKSNIVASDALMPGAAGVMRKKRADAFQQQNEKSGVVGILEFDVPGNETALPSALHRDLLPGEKILRQFDVDVKIKVSCFTKLLYCLMICCRCCMPSPIFAQRRRLVLTDRGRIGFFSTNLNGVKAGCCCGCGGGIKANSHTTIQWYHVSDMSAASFYNGQKKTWWKCCCKEPFSAEIKLFFNRYPSVAQLNGGGMPGGLGGLFGMTDGAGMLQSHRLVVPIKKMKADIPRSLFQSVASGATTLFKQCWPGNPLAAICLPFCLTCCECCNDLDTLPNGRAAPNTAFDICIVSQRSDSRYDEAHPDKEEQEASMRTMFEAITAATSGGGPTGIAPGGAAESKNITSGPLSFFTADPDGKPHFNIVNHPATLLEGTGPGMPSVNVQAKFLMPGEVVVDAVPYYPRMSWFQFLSSCCNFCCLCPSSLNGALVLTNRRLMSIFIDSRAAARGDGASRSGFCGGEFQQTIEAFSLGEKGFAEGLMGLGKADASLLIRNKFGGLRVAPQLRNRYPFQCSTSNKLRARARTFLSNFVSGSKTQVLATPPPGFNAGVPDEIQQVVPLMQGESYVATIRSEGLYKNLQQFRNACSYCCTCGNEVGLINYVRCCTCGCAPYENVTHVILTTHRLVAVGFLGNKPWGCSSIFSVKGLVMYWQPLTNTQGYEASSTVDIDQNGCKKCGFCACCCSPGWTNMTIDVAGIRGFPVPLQRFLPSANGGLLEEPQTDVIRRALNMIVSAPGMPAGVDVSALPGAAAPVTGVPVAHVMPQQGSAV